MKAVFAAASGPRLDVTPDPTPATHQVVVAVRASAVNHLDLHLAFGHSHGANGGGEGSIVGMEFSGEVIQIGDEVDPSWLGRRVMGTRAGSWAERIVTVPAALMKVPDGLSDAAAACLPVGVVTMHDALVTSGGLGPDGSALVQGATSGVGLIGLQVARLLGATTVIGTTRSSARTGMLRKHGATHTLITEDPDWEHGALDATDGRGVDIGVDLVGGPNLDPMIRAVRIAGTLVNVGRMGGDLAKVDLDLHAARRTRFIGATFRSRTVEESLAALAGARAFVNEHGSELQVPITATYQMGEVAEALELVASGRGSGGKVVLHW